MLFSLSSIGWLTIATLCGFLFVCLSSPPPPCPTLKIFFSFFFYIYILCSVLST